MLPQLRPCGATTRLYRRATHPIKTNASWSRHLPEIRIASFGEKGLATKPTLATIFSAQAPSNVALTGVYSVKSMRMVALAPLMTRRGYCTSKQEKKEENETQREEVVDADGKTSPFGRKARESEDAYVPPKEEEKFVPPGAPEQKTRDPTRVFTPTYIITINTEKTWFRRLWRGLGLISFNFVIASRSWKTTLDGKEIPAFWQQQLHTARLDALLFMWSMTAITGADLMIFIIWLIGAIYFPGQLLPSVFRTPSRGDVRAFVLGHLKDLDPNGTGFAPVADAKRVLMVVEKTMTDQVLQAVLDAADATETEVNYEKLADVVVGSSSSQ